MNRRKFGQPISARLLVCLVATGALTTALLAGADAPESPKVSRFAPAKDLKAQVDFYVGRLQESLANRAEYDETKQSRVNKDANTLAVLALALGMHDEPNPIKGTSADLIRASRALEKSHAEYEAAVKALADVKKAVASGGQNAVQMKWEKVAQLDALMKQVPLVHAALKRTVERRFERQAADAAGQSATLAAIAQASMFDLEHVEAKDAGAWRRFCAEMRDAAGEINSAAHAGNQGAARAGLARLSKSCDACHEVFRQEK
jgi:hypothetical protein